MAVRFGGSGGGISALTIGAGATVITGGSANRLLYDAGGTLGEIGALTSTRVLFADTNGLPTGSANLTFDGTTLAVTGAITASQTIMATSYLRTAAGVQINAFTGDNFLQIQGAAGGWRFSNVLLDGFVYVNAFATNATIQFNGTTSSFPMLRRNGTLIEAKLADNSGYATYDGLFAAAGTTGVASFGPSIVTSITVKNGLITAIS